MERKVTVDVTVRLIIRASEGQSIDEVIDDMNYNFTASENVEADIESEEILEYELVDVS